VIELLDLALATAGARSNGLGRLAGGWSEKEFRDFERATAQFEKAGEESYPTVSVATGGG
jgi:hypothetical protein